MFIIAVFLFSAIVMGLWNAILPEVIAVKTISLWQAMGILLLSKILFGGFRGGWRSGEGKARWMQMQQKLASMTPEEKEKFKSEWKNRCASWKMRGQETPGPATD
jgi:hypothetical protein